MYVLQFANGTNFTSTVYLRICSVTAHIACISHLVGIQNITWKILALHRKTSIKQNALNFDGSLANCVSLCAICIVYSLKHLPSSMECKIQYLRKTLCCPGACVVVISTFWHNVNAVDSICFMKPVLPRMHRIVFDKHSQ